MSSVPWTLDIHQSLHRPNHVMGAEREPVLCCGLIAFLVGVGGFSMASGVCGISFWLFSVFALRMMAKKDPIMTQVWRKHIGQQEFYSASSCRWRSPLGGFKNAKS